MVFFLSSRGSTNVGLGARRVIARGGWADAGRGSDTNGGTDADWGRVADWGNKSADWGQDAHRSRDARVRPKLSARRDLVGALQAPSLGTQDTARLGRGLHEALERVEQPDVREPAALHGLGGLQAQELAPRDLERREPAGEARGPALSQPLNLPEKSSFHDK